MARPVTLKLLAACLCTLTACGPASESRDPRPNVLLILADDLGYADLGSYGSDISTPNLDALANRGIRFSQFHTAPMCAPSRAMLLSGNDNHVAGMGYQSGGGPPEFARGAPGYEQHLSDRIVPLPQLLQDAGYHTYAVGKWHLGTASENSAKAAGFDRSFMLLQGGGDHYSNTAYSRADSVSTYWVDDDYGEWPDGAYGMEFYTDRLISNIREGLADGGPFFAYAAVTSPHWPLQVPEEYRDRYRGQYDMGYDRLREMRLESLKEAGLIDADHPLPPRIEGVKRWDELTPTEQRREARKMELYAAMVDNMDFHIGRLFQFLEEEGVLENTLVVFASDNGAAAEDFYNRGGYVDWLRSNYDNSYENMGSPTSHVSYGPQWADAGSAPFRGHKQHATEGGIVAPMIIAGPGVEVPGAIQRAFVGIQDIAPTVLTVAGLSYPGDRGTSLTQPMTGVSMLPLLAGEAVAIHPESAPRALSHRGEAYLRVGDWKLVTNTQYRGDETFRLYDLSTDPGEATDLSGRYPARRAEMLDSMQSFRARVGVVLPPGDRGGP